MSSPSSSQRDDYFGDTLNTSSSSSPISQRRRRSIDPSPRNRANLQPPKKHPLEALPLTDTLSSRLYTTAAKARGPHFTIFPSKDPPPSTVLSQQSKTPPLNPIQIPDHVFNSAGKKHSPSPKNDRPTLLKASYLGGTGVPGATHAKPKTKRPSVTALSPFRADPHNLKSPLPLPSIPPAETQKRARFESPEVDEPSQTIPFSPNEESDFVRPEYSQLTNVSDQFRGAAKAGKDPFAFIAALNKRKNLRIGGTANSTAALEFAYLSPVKKDSPSFNPYNLEIVNHDEIDRDNFYTISAEGVTHFLHGIAEFTSLQQWTREHHLFNSTIRISFFAKYPQWKSFTVWRNNVRSAMIGASKKQLAKNLFILDATLRAAIFELRTACVDAMSWKLVKIADGTTYDLQTFSQDQKTWDADTMAQRLKNFQARARIVVETACETSLKQAGFEVNKENEGEEGANEPNPQDPSLDSTVAEPKKMTFTEQAARRTECRRLQRFVKLADYMIVHALHMLAVNSVKTVLETVSRRCTDQQIDLAEEDREHVFSKVPTALLLRAGFDSFTALTVRPSPSSNLSDDASNENPPSSTSSSSVPLFRTELLMHSHTSALMFKPDLPDFMSRIDSLIKSIVAQTETYNLMTSTIPYLEQNDRFEEPEYGEGPSLPFIIYEGLYFQALVARIRGALTGAFKLAVAHGHGFDAFRDMYLENSRMDFESVKQRLCSTAIPPIAENESVRLNMSDDEESSPALAFFESSMSKYSAQKKDMELIATESVVANFLVDSTKLKALFLPSPERCFQSIASLLPGLARDKNEVLLSDLNHSVRVLGSTPQNVEGFVEYLAHLAKVKQCMPAAEYQFTEVTRLYSLMELYRVPVSPTELAVFQTLAPTMRQLKDTVEMADDTREDNISKFSLELEKNTTDLVTEVLEIRNRAQDPMILNPNSKIDPVLRFLDDLQQQIAKLSATADDYARYQQELKIPPTKSSELDETKAELQLKRTLWTSFREWEAITEQWKSQQFEQLNPDDINGQIQTYLKQAYVLDKGLPPNDVVPKLKQMIEDYRTIYPTIVDLRNQALKTRHWDKIQDAVGVQLIRDETFTLGKIRELKIFDFKEEISAISSQASSEAALEEMLNKIVAVWSDVEFTVLPYRDSKDVFVLGGVDDIQTQLEDSQVTIATLRSSRFLGPIKSDVERWDKQLALFAETLDAWTTCQRSWLYLESIFGAPDIQRQLPDEAKMFSQVDRTWKDVMRKVARNPNAMKAGTMPGLLEMMQQNNDLLDKIQKCLEDYLESKRLLFPRFYFLSNDELLEILSQTRNPQAVQPHLSKCFDAIKSLEFSSEPKSIDILAMQSPEGERMPFVKTVKARGNVEAWLSTVEETMFSTIRRACKAALVEYEPSKRNQWVLSHAGQVVLTASQVIWCRDVTEVLKGPQTMNGLKDFKNKCVQNLSGLAGLVRGELTKLQRNILGALITIEVHNRDIITNMIAASVTSARDFEWTKQLRYYWDADSDACTVKMSSSSDFYGCEYLGCSPRLVITPLTDRCYLTLTSAMALNLGGSPVGPAGTGKTETVKDLAKALARQCVVFNCSDSLDYKIMGKFFAGLAQSGAWCCFDEFNRIDIEVLSVIAQQLLTIKNAKDAKLTKFNFEGREIRLISACAAFITMNPGYAGRTELPDNLKALFRPIAMMIPDYGLIAEIILFSEGFEGAKELSGKVVNLYKLCSEQLSQQDHYDFGMRAVKSVLVMAGSLKRANPDVSEVVVLIRSLRDSNLPKFLAEDVPLFRGILQDLFPGVVIPNQDYGALQTQVEETMRERGLQIVPSHVDRIIQLADTMKVRHGVMLVGPTGGGKTTSYEVLAESLTKLREKGHRNQDFQKVKTSVLNPKCITMAELYGEFNMATMEWKDGLIGTVVRQQVSDNSPDEKWTVCDGPVDALWIENMNTVLDDNKLLCLANSERIKMNNTMHMLFEVADLAVASPATVSRCGMVYMDPANLGWRPYVQSWLQRLPSHVHQEHRDIVMPMFEAYVDAGLNFVRKQCKEHVPSVNLNLVVSLCKLLQTFFNRTVEIDFSRSLGEIKPLLGQLFIFCYVWSIGGNVADSSYDDFDSFARKLFENGPVQEYVMPESNSVYSYYVDLKNRSYMVWDDIVPAFKYSQDVPYFQMTVPTVDTVRYQYLVEALVASNYPVLLTGTTGVGKSVIIQNLLGRISKKNSYVAVNLNFSAQTTSSMTQQIMEYKLEKKRKNILGAPNGMRIVMFVDDVNMPKLDTYGSQPPIELLRQYLDFGGFYDREKLTWKIVQDVSLIAACAPPGGGRNAMTPRFLRHFNMLSIPQPSDSSLSRIFRSMVDGFMKPFNGDVRQTSEAVVHSSIEIYNRMCTELLPTPAKSHYTFNLRDLSKVIQGVLQMRPSVVTSKVDIVKVFCHESSRIFHDRLIDEADRSYFNKLLSEVVEKNFGVVMPKETFTLKPIMFGDFMKRGVPPEERLYAELADMKALDVMLEDYLEEYNVTYSKDVRLIFFMDAKQHITRISRILRQPRGNALLVGVGGTGKQSLTRLACHVADYQCRQIELTRTYGQVEWREDLKKLFMIAGVEGKNTVFLLTDTQIKSETFLEDVNNILNTGEVPGLFELDEREKILSDLRQVAREKGQSEDRDGINQFFINRVRDNLHIVFATSPVGDTFRNRCRMFPSLVNCCTIDWFDIWPKDALLSVARRFLEFVDLGSDEMKEKISEMCVEIHSSVSEMSVRFYAELRRRYYTTPTSYLELINSYTTLLQEKRKELGSARDRLRNGLSKLAETNEMVEKMQVELESLGPELKNKAQDVEVLMVKIAKDQETADGVKKVVGEEEAIVKEKAMQTETIATEAQKDLDEALPALNNAYKALDSLEKKDISEMKGFAKPPEMVMTVMEAVCILFKVKPDWDGSKKLLSDPQFMKKMLEFDKDNVPEAVAKKLQKYIQNPNFNPEAVEKVSRAAKSLCLWVCAIDVYTRVFKEVQPKKRRLEEAQQTLEATKQKLQEKTAALREVEEQLEKLKSKYESSIASKKVLSEKMEETTRRLSRASKLVVALADEQIRWTDSVGKLDKLIDDLVGNVFLSAACVAYYGAFTSTYRSELVGSWIKKCQELGIPVSENFNLVDQLSDQVIVREWNVQGLPSDQLSTENGILVSRGRRWPLMIDPQGQANRWIRSKEGAELKIIKLTDGKFLRSLENAIRTGQPVLLEDIGEQLDPALEPLLLKQTVRQGGRLLMKLGDNFVEYDKNFRLYITTKLSNPHYMPEVCIKVTIINFTVTKQGLEGQLLGDVVKLEKPELEEQRSSLIMSISADKKQLKDVEEKILRMLYNSQGNILDDEELIDTLNQSKVTSSVITERVIQAEQTEKDINAARERYRSVAIRGSVLYFVVADLAEIDPMYQFSLKYFKNIFNLCITNSAKMDNLDAHIAVLCKEISYTVYDNVSRALFEQHKTIFAFMICIELMRERREISDDEWNFFLRGSVNLKSIPPPKPSVRWISDAMWKGTFDLSQSVSNLAYISEHMSMYAGEWEGIVESDEPYSEHVPGEPGNAKLTDFQRLLLVKVLREERLVVSAIEFVKRNLGQEYIDSLPLDLGKAYKDMSTSTPLIFILSTGSDPITPLTKFASLKEFNMADRLHMISLGQGQGPIAEDLIKRATLTGDWVFLQNCHLAASWMNRLETIVKDFNNADAGIHPNFRMFLSSMPSKVFPIAVLQDGVKVTNEPPKGLRANLARFFAEMKPEEYETTQAWGPVYRKLLFGVCFFNAVIQERKKFGPLGWNITYDWSDADLQVSITIMRNLLQEQSQVPWDALNYLTGEIAFGGRVTDEWDRRAAKSILGKYYNPQITEDGYRFSPSGVYYAPPDGDIGNIRSYVEGLPYSEDPSVFGMHENANISFQLQETKRLIRTIVDVQPRLVTAGGSGRTSEQVVSDVATAILDSWPPPLVLEPPSWRAKATGGEVVVDPVIDEMFKEDENGRVFNSLSIVLSQETVRFNRLVHTVRTSLETLLKAIKGFVVMSAELDLVFRSLLNNEVPGLWARNAYPSLKSLADWIVDFHQRIEFFRDWIVNGQPKTFWLPGFFFPQGFLTGSLQNHARKYNIPIDTLSFSFNILSVDKVDEDPETMVTGDYEEEGKDGVLIRGLFMEGARWDREKCTLQDSFSMEMFCDMPIIRFIPCADPTIGPNTYVCPLYKTSARAGVLTTTGASSNYVLAITVPSIDKSSDYWISKGVAMLMQKPS